MGGGLRLRGPVEMYLNYNSRPHLKCDRNGCDRSDPGLPCPRGVNTGFRTFALCYPGYNFGTNPFVSLRTTVST